MKDWRSITIPALMALGLIAALVLITIFASSPCWLVLYPFLIISLLVVSGWIVIGVLRRL